MIPTYINASDENRNTRLYFDKAILKYTETISGNRISAVPINTIISSDNIN
jgi:hypothetical protein